MWNPDNTVKGSYRTPSGEEFAYTLQGGEMLFSKSGQSASFGELGLNETEQLNLISRALYAQAQNGYDPDSGIKTAAAHVVRDEITGERRVFVASNANSRSRQQRPHAEVNALVFAKNAVKDQNFKVEKTYLTLFNPKSDNKIPATPCGHCREDLTDKKFVDENAQLYCLPSLDPDAVQTIPEIAVSNQPNISQTPLNHAFTMKMMDMARKPLPIGATTPDDINYWKDHMKQGIDYAKKPDAEVPFRPVRIEQSVRDEIAKLAETGNSGRLLHLESEHGTLPRINQQLANMIKTACQQNADSLGQLHKVRACLAIRENGEMYGGTYIDIKTHSAKPQAEVMALGNALNVKDIKEMYLMEMDENYIARSLKEEGAPKLKMPYPEALDGIMKNSHCPEVPAMPSPTSTINTANHSRCMIHVIALNNGDLPEEKLKKGMVSAPIEHLLSSPFQAPTMHQGKVVANIGHVSCCC